MKKMFEDFFCSFMAMFIIMTIVVCWIFALFTPLHLASYGSIWNLMWEMITIPFAVGYTVTWMEYIKIH